jgi:hypothetical protein
MRRCSDLLRFQDWKLLSLSTENMLEKLRRVRGWNYSSGHFGSQSIVFLIIPLRLDVLTAWVEPHPYIPV